MPTGRRWAPSTPGPWANRPGRCGRRSGRRSGRASTPSCNAARRPGMRACCSFSSAAATPRRPTTRSRTARCPTTAAGSAGCSVWSPRRPTACSASGDWRCCAIWPHAWRPPMLPTRSSPPSSAAWGAIHPICPSRSPIYSKTRRGGRGWCRGPRLRRVIRPRPKSSSSGARRRAGHWPTCWRRRPSRSWPSWIPAWSGRAARGPTRPTARCWFPSPSRGRAGRRGSSSPASTCTVRSTTPTARSSASSWGSCRPASPTRARTRPNAAARPPWPRSIGPRPSSSATSATNFAPR